MSTIKLPAASGGGSISLKGPSSAGSDTDFLDTSGNVNVTGDLKINGGGFYVAGSDNPTKAQDGVLIHRNSSSGLVEFVAGRAGGNFSGIENYVAGASGVTKRYDNLYSGEHRWFGADGTTEEVRIQAAGGISFNGDTASANALDDYEEGTFTPKLGGSNISTYSVNGAGKYTKIGRMVHVEWRFENVDLDNSSVNQVRIIDFPYAFNLTTTRPQCGSLMMNNVILPTSHDEHTYVFYAETTTELRGLIGRDAVSWDGWDVTNFQSSGLYLEGTFSYHT